MKGTSKTLTYGRKCKKNHVLDFVHMSEMPTVNIKGRTYIFYSLVITLWQSLCLFERHRVDDSRNKLYKCLKKNLVTLHTFRCLRRLGSGLVK